MNEKKEHPKVSKTIIDWFFEGIKKVFVDTVAVFVPKFIEWLVGLKIAPIIFAAVIALFVYLLNWLKTPITFPAFIIPIAIVLYLLIIWLTKKYGRIIHNTISRVKERNLFSLIWRVNGNSLEGPLCPTCHSTIVLPKQDFFTQATTIAGKIKGETANRIYTYRCTACDYQCELELSPENLIKMVRQALGLNN
jgi:hypothetical protein